MGEMEHTSLHLDEIKAIKRALVKDRPYADRISFGFAIRLFIVKSDRREDHVVLDEIDHLEGLLRSSKTKREEQFRYPPLYPFWHKHYFAPRHMYRNISESWGLPRGGNKRLETMIQNVAETHGNDPAMWQGMIAHRLAIEGYEARAKRGLTGDWIIFAKHEGKNYYLDLASHEEGHDPERLYVKLRRGSAAEFPFIF
jgi:hypothetical protein